MIRWVLLLSIVVAVLIVAVAILAAKVLDLEARVAALEGGPTPLPPFVIGETFPDETTVGAGILRPYPTEHVTGVTVFQGEPYLVHDLIFDDLVQIKSDGWEFENCAFRGPVVRTSGSQIVWIDQTRVTPAGLPIFRYCDINPQTASPYWNGIGWKLYRLEMCRVWGATDCLAAFARSDDPDRAVHITVLGTWLSWPSQFKPDTAGNRDVTHNDLIQLQGNVGPDDDVLFDGCRFDAYASPVQSSPLPPTHTQISALMLTPNQQDRVCVTVRRSWLTGGVYTVNASAASNAKSVLVLTDNQFEKPRSGGPSAAIAINAVLTTRTLDGNVYDDGSAVPVYVPK